MLLKLPALPRLLPLCAAVLLIVGCKSGPAFQTRCANIKTLAVLPAQVRTGVAGVGGKLQGKLEKEEVVRDDVSASIIEQFRKRGFTVKECGVWPREGATNALWDTHTTHALKGAYDNLPTSGTRPEGPELAEHLQSDGLVFVNILAFRSSDGRKAFVGFMNFLSMVGAAAGAVGDWQPYTRAMVAVALVDGKTGKVMWRGFRDFKDIEKASGTTMAENVMKDFPIHENQ